MTFRFLAAGFFVAAVLGIVAAAIAYRPDVSARRLAAHVESAQLRPQRSGGWEYYADPDAVRRNAMERQRKAMSGPLVESAEAEFNRFSVVAAPLGAIALLSAIAFAMLGRRAEAVRRPPRPVRRRPVRAASRR